MQALVLVIEDEQEIRELLRYNLERAGFRVALAETGEAGLERAFAARPDAVVLDLMLPGLNGLDVLRELREEPNTKELPVLVLTARGTEMDKLLGFERGADDYVVKPFSPREIVARLQALLRRARPEREGALEVGPLSIDAASREVRIDGRAVSLTPREFDLVAFMARRPGRVYSREELLRKVWGYDYMGETRTVDVHVRRLRAKFGAMHRVIETVTGAGYKLVAGPLVAETGPERR